MRCCGISYPVGHDTGSTVDRYGLIGFPETFFFDPRGPFAGPHVEGAISTQQLARNLCLALR